MKKNIFIYLFVIIGFFSGCKKFLNLPPKNERSVETLQDVKSALAGYLDGVKTKYVRPMIGPFPIFTERQVMMFESFSDNIDFENAMPKYLNL